ncbi:MAG: hypothetical protein HYU84_04620 [Chloroflexi bacterium]|nr:hypothetical protein [Chloroflexota bacterium]
MRKKKHISEKSVELPVIDISDLDSRTVYMLGLPGHRTAMNRSGLGYLATQTELAYMQGLMLKWLFTGKFRTHSPIFLFVMFILGSVGGFIPLGVALIEIFWHSNLEMILFIILAFPYLAIGNALFVNTILSCVDWDGETITGD